MLNLENKRREQRIRNRQTRLRVISNNENIYARPIKSSIKMCIASRGFFSDIYSFLEIISLPTLFDSIYTGLDTKINNGVNTSPNVHNLENDIYNPEITQFMDKKQFIDNKIITNRITNKRNPFLIYIDDNPEILNYNINEYILFGNYEIYENKSDIIYEPFALFDTLNNNINLDINNYDFIIIRLPKNNIGLQKKHMDFIGKMKNNIIKRNILMVFDFDCTITKKHLTISGGKAIMNTNSKNTFRSDFIKEFKNNNNNPTYNNVLENIDLREKLIKYFIDEKVIIFLKSLKVKVLPKKVRQRPLPSLLLIPQEEEQSLSLPQISEVSIEKKIPSLANLTVKEGEQVNIKNKRTKRQKFLNFITKPFRKTKKNSLKV